MLYCQVRHLTEHLDGSKSCLDFPGENQIADCRSDDLTSIVAHEDVLENICAMSVRFFVGLTTYVYASLEAVDLSEQTFLVCPSRFGIRFIGGLRGLVAESSQAGFELASTASEIVGCCKPGGNRRSVCGRRSPLAAGRSRDVRGNLPLKHGDVIGDTVTNLQTCQDAVSFFLQLCSDHWSLLRAVGAARHYYLQIGINTPKTILQVVGRVRYHILIFVEGSEGKG